VPVEQQFIVPAELVERSHRHAVLRGVRPHDRLVLVRFAHHKRAGRRADNQLRARRDKFGDGVGRVGVMRGEPRILAFPQVLADRQADPHAADVDHPRSESAVEVPILVEDVVGRQQPLVIEGDASAVPIGAQRVGDRAARVVRVHGEGCPKDGRDAPGVFDPDPIGPCAAGFDEPVL